MKILAFDTTDSTFTAVLIKDDDTILKSFEVGKSGHSSLILPTIQAMMDEGCVAPQDLDAIGVVIGPGSFTGIRIGVSVATAMAYGTKAKRIAVNSFELLAYSRSKATLAIYAGHGHHYVAECVDGEIVSTDFVEAKDSERVKGAITTTSCGRAEILDRIARQKWSKGEFVSVFEPFYMRKSQAERNNEI